VLIEAGHDARIAQTSPHAKKNRPTRTASFLGGGLDEDRIPNTRFSRLWRRIALSSSDRGLGAFDSGTGKHLGNSLGGMAA